MEQNKQQAIFKYNGGQGALLCSNCRVIIKTGKDFTDEEKKAIKWEVTLPAQYCENCKNHVSKQKTAVEWLREQYNQCPNWEKQIHEEDWEKAKAMEKDQIIDAHIEGQRVFDTHDHTQWTTDQAEHYYNETYTKT